MKKFGIAKYLRVFFRKSMQQWRLLLTTYDEELREVNVKMGDIPGNLSLVSLSLSVVPLLRR